MKRENSLNVPLIVVMFLTFISMASRSFGIPPVKQEYYELKVYRYSQKAQEERIDIYLRDVYIPALHRAGISKVGVFKPIEADTASGKMTYLFIPFKTFNQYLNLPELLLGDKVYTETSKSFVDAPVADPPYRREESILLKAFQKMPKFAIPSFTTPVAERIYELRSYESATEAKASKKIDMFNNAGEVALFEQLGFNAVFYGEVLAGSHKPNLMYMTTFQDMKSRDAHWKSFIDSPEWKRMSGLEEYKSTVSKSDKFLLHPTSYSDF